MRLIKVTSDTYECLNKSTRPNVAVITVNIGAVLDEFH